MKNKIIFFLFLFIIIPMYSLSMEDTSQEIHNSINNLKTEIKDLQNDLCNLTFINNQQLIDIENLEKEKLNLNTSLDETITQLNEYSSQIQILDMKLHKSIKIVTVLGIIFIVMIIIKIIVMILKLKLNINLPYWLNCLL